MQQVLDTKQERLERLISNHYLRQWVKLNYNRDIEIRFKLAPVTNFEAMEKAKVFIDAAARGAVKVDLPDENKIRAMLGFDPVDEKLREERQKMAMEIAQQTKPKEDDDGNEEEEEPGEEKEDEPEKPETDIRENANTREIKKFLIDSEDRAKKELSELIISSAEGMVSEAKKKSIVEKRNHLAAVSLTMKNRKRIEALFKRHLHGILKRGRGDAKTEIKLVTNDLGPAVEANPEKYLSSIAMTATKGLTDDIEKQIRQMIAVGIKDGDSMRDIQIRIEEMLAGYDVKVPIQGPKGVLTAPKLEAVVRTNVATAYNEGRMQFFEQQGEIIHAFQYNAIMDDRTTPRCSQLHGKVIRKSEARIFHSSLTSHVPVHSCPYNDIRKAAPDRRHDRTPGSPGGVFQMTTAGKRYANNGFSGGDSVHSRDIHTA